MFDPTMFVSVWAALVAGFITIEILSFGLGFVVSLKQAQRAHEVEQEFAKAIAEGRVPPGMNPMSLMGNGAGNPAPYPAPTASGGADPDTVQTGQYL